MAVSGRCNAMQLCTQNLVGIRDLPGLQMLETGDTFIVL